MDLISGGYALDGQQHKAASTSPLLQGSSSSVILLTTANRQQELQHGWHWTEGELSPSYASPWQALCRSCGPSTLSLNPRSALQVKETLGLGEAKAERAAERTTGHPHHSHMGVGTSAERPATGYTGGVAGGPAYAGTAVSRHGAVLAHSWLKSSIVSL